jgi:ELWxxDGT repeat protein
LRRSCAAFLAIAPLVFAAPAAAQGPYLVRDINQLSTNGGSYPDVLGVLGGVAFFSGAKNDIDRELWRTDGTESGTWQVADICPDYCSSSPGPMMATPAGFFFAAYDGISSGLWITRGEPASTFRLTDDASVFTSPRPVWDERRQLLFFVARDDRGNEIWRSDGTAAGTYRVTDINPQFEAPGPGGLTLLGDELFFWGNDGRRGPALWATDGTSRGTWMIKSFGRPNAIGGPYNIRAVGRVLIFLEASSSRGVRLWKSNGTTQGTVPLATLSSRETAETISELMVGSRLFFTFSEGFEASSSLWVTNGTANGTYKLGSFAPESALLARISFGSKVFFRAKDSAHGAELWTTDGTPGGTRLFKDFCPGPCSSFAFPRLVFRNRLVLQASTPQQGSELWTTNGTPAGTRILRDICPGPCGSFFGILGVRNGRLFFFATDETSREEIWSSDGTSRGTSPVYRLAPDQVLVPGISYYSYATIPTGFLFIVFDETYGQEPWFTDGTSAGTHVLRDIVTFPDSSDPQGLMPLGNEVFFFARDRTRGYELWKSDGTGEGTRLAAELTPGREPTSPPRPGKHVEAGGKLFFQLNPGLWKTDGTQAGTLQITPENLQIGSELATAGDRVFFNAGDVKNELWVSDGTVEGTHKVGQPLPGPVERFTSFQGRLYFSSAGSLWASDGTPERTGPLPAAELLEDVQYLTAHQGSLYFFSSRGPGDSTGLWRTDGTPAGTALVIEVAVVPDDLVSTGERLFFSGYSPGQDGLWVSDGTTEGTLKIAEEFRIQDNVTIFNGGLYVWTFSHVFWKSDGTIEGTGLVDLEVEDFTVRGPLVAFGDHLYAAALDALVETDGTPEGTRLLRGTSPWQLYSLQELVAAGPHLFFSAFSEETGQELWALPAGEGVTN